MKTVSFLFFYSFFLAVLSGCKIYNSLNGYIGAPPKLSLLYPPEGEKVKNGVYLKGKCTSGVFVSISGKDINPKEIPCENGRFEVAVPFLGDDGIKKIQIKQLQWQKGITSVTRTFIKDSSLPNPPTVTSFVVQNGETQRSFVDTLKFTFDQNVNIQNFISSQEIQKKVKIINLGIDADNDPNTIVPLASTQFQYNSGTKELSWSLNSFASNSRISLEEGLYEVSLDAISILSDQGFPLDGDGDGIGGDDYKTYFHRLTLDDNGDGVLSYKINPDFFDKQRTLNFYTPYFASTSPYADLNEDGYVNGIDLPFLLEIFSKNHHIILPQSLKKGPELLNVKIQEDKQNSYLDMISLHFDTPTNLQQLINNGTITTATQVINLGTNPDIDPDTPITLNANQFEYDNSKNTLIWSYNAFSGTWNSLPDGVYLFRLLSSQVKGPDNKPLNGRKNSLFQGDLDIIFHRLKGDLDKNGIVESPGGDADVLTSLIGTTSSSPNWNIGADLNGDGVIDSSDQTILNSLNGNQVSLPSSW